jgi:hypothetical protein
MDDRVPSEKTRDRGVGQGKLGHGAHLESQLGVIAAGQLDHCRRQVDPELLDAQVMQVGRDMARPAADVNNLPTAIGVDQIGE